jgi:hypothetical protein
VAAKLTLSYDREGDILHVSVGDIGARYPFEFLPDDIVVAYDRETREVQHLDILGFSRRFPSLDDDCGLPISATLTLDVSGSPCD